MTFMVQQRSLSSQSLVEARNLLRQLPYKHRSALCDVPGTVTSPEEFIFTLLGCTGGSYNPTTISSIHKSINLLPGELDIPRAYSYFVREYAAYIERVPGQIDALRYLEQFTVINREELQTPRKSLKKCPAQLLKRRQRDIGAELMRAFNSNDSMIGTPMTMKALNVPVTPRFDRIALARSKYYMWLSERNDAVMGFKPVVTEFVEEHNLCEALSTKWTKLSNLFHTSVKTEIFHVWSALIDSVIIDRIEKGSTHHSLVGKLLSEDWHKGIILYACEVVRFGNQNADLPPLEGIAKALSIRCFDTISIFEECRPFESLIGNGLIVRMRMVAERILEVNAWRSDSGSELVLKYLQEAPHDFSEDLHKSLKVIRTSAWRRL